MRPIELQAGCLLACLLLLSVPASAADAEPPAAEPLPLPPLEEPWTGDFDGMVERGMIRALVVPSKTFYFLDGAAQRGFTYELLKQFEAHVNRRLGGKTGKVELVFVPVTRDQLLPGLTEGRGDIAAANLTITPEREEQVAFSEPLLTDVDEIVVTGPSAGPPLDSLDDLSGRAILVRPSSSYYQSLERLNDTFRAAGKRPVRLVAAPEYLEDEDLLELVDAGLLALMVIDSHKAEFWAQIFKNITLHREVAVNTGGRIAWAMRKDSPKLREVVNDFIPEHQKGTLLGNVIYERYLEDPHWVKNARSTEEIKKFRETEPLFRKYAEQYGLDWLLLAAQGYQESQLDQDRRSPAGAVGVMQLLPATARSSAVEIPRIERLEDNIHAGAKYLRWLLDTHFDDPELDSLNRHLFAFAAYNASPERIKALREQARGIKGVDPNQWFGHVENLAARQIGRQPVQYVGNIFKYYLAYQGTFDIQDTKEEVKEVLEEKLAD